MNKPPSHKFVNLLAKLLEDQNSIQSSIQASQGLVSYSEPRLLIERILTDAPEVRVFKTDNVSPSEFKKLLLEHVMEREALYQKLSQIKPSKNNQSTLEERLRIFHEKFLKKIVKDTKNPVPYLAVRQRVLAVMDSPRPLPTINQALYILAFANFESFLSSVVSEAYLHADSLLYDPAETYNWKQILGRGSVQKLRKEASQTRTAELLRRSMGDWIRWFEKRARLSLEGEFKTECETLYKLRNLFAHEKSSKTMRMNLASDELVTKANDVLFKLAVEFVCSLVGTFEKDFEHERVALEKLVTNMTLDLLQKRRFEAAVSLGVPVLRILKKQIPETMVNIWIAKKVGHLGQDYLDSVKDWDADSLGNRFVIAKFALLDQKRQARRLAREMILEGELTLVEWLTWPIFDAVRGRAL